MSAISLVETADPIKPTIIGLYGISGSGKSHILQQLRNDTSLEEKRFVFYDGSELLDQATPGGLEGFKRLDQTTKKIYIETALDLVSRTCLARKETAVIAGHYIFWMPEQIVGIERDWKTYTHMVYLNTDPALIAQRIKADTTKTRNVIDEDDLRAWQGKEKIELRKICRERDILFTTVTENASSMVGSTVAKVKVLLMEFQQHTEAKNLLAAEQALEEAMIGQENLDKVLLFDADKTLAAQDTGILFWDMINSTTKNKSMHPLKALFGTQGYSYASFRQATLLYEEEADQFDDICDRVASTIEMYPEMIDLLRRVAKEPHVAAVVVTCGLRLVWEKVLARNGLSHIKIIGGGQLADGYVVTDSVKGHIVDMLHQKGLRVVAFGDSPLDMEMLKKVDEAHVVVGDETIRSSTMNKELENAICDGYGFTQLSLPPGATPRLDLHKLPRITLDAAELDHIFKPRQPVILETNKNLAKLLATPTRDAAIQGHALRQAHEDIGYHLATSYLSAILGVEEYPIAHVQGKPTDGYRFRNESNTLVIPLMRGGEPMAFGVSRALKTASFVHAKHFSDIHRSHFHGKRNVVLVDSVINSGASIVEFVVELRKVYPALRVVVVAGVVQAGAIRKGGDVVKEGGRVGDKVGLADMLREDCNLSIVALRTSENSYKGVGGTDTGHRLFNTTNLE
jgi:uracil phosphoribosyltransferase/phosphoserine phosphatase/adenylate kinase